VRAIPSDEGSDAAAAPEAVAAAPSQPMAAAAEPAAGPVLDAERRAAVEAAIDELSELRKWLAKRVD